VVAVCLVLSVVGVDARRKKALCSIATQNPYNYMCTAETSNASYTLTKSLADSHMVCSTTCVQGVHEKCKKQGHDDSLVLGEAFVEDGMQELEGVSYATVKCPQKPGPDGSMVSGKIECLMYAGIGAVPTCPDDKCSADDFTDDTACATCSYLGQRCDECEYLPASLGEACVGVESCNIGVSETEWVSSAGQRIPFKAAKLPGEALKVIAYCGGAGNELEEEKEEEKQVLNDAWEEAASLIPNLG